MAGLFFLLFMLHQMFIVFYYKNNFSEPSNASVQLLLHIATATHVLLIFGFLLRR